MDYEDYLGSEQKEKEDQVFLEFNRRHGLHVSTAFDGTIVAVCIAAIIATVAWVAFF
jgi:hypothetical protein